MVRDKPPKRKRLTLLPADAGVEQEVSVSFRELTMNEVREIGRRWQARQGLREMARKTGLDRKTVRRYVEALQELDAGRDAPLDDGLVHEIAMRVQSRRLPEPSIERTTLSEHADLIKGWLTQKKPLRLTKVHVLLARDHHVVASYATLRRFARDGLDPVRWTV